MFSNNKRNIKPERMQSAMARLVPNPEQLKNGENEYAEADRVVLRRKRGGLKIVESTI